MRYELYLTNTNVNESTISIRVNFSNTYFRCLELPPGIAEEGNIRLPYRLSSE